MFFFSNTHKSAYHSLKKGVGVGSPKNTNTRFDAIYMPAFSWPTDIQETVRTTQVTAHSAGHMPSSISPAFVQDAPSSLSIFVTQGSEGVAPLKTMSFLCLQSAHIPSMHSALVNLR